MRALLIGILCLASMVLRGQSYVEIGYTPRRDFLDKDRHNHGSGDLWQVRGMHTFHFSQKVNSDGQPTVWAGTLSGMYAHLDNKGYAASYNPGQILNLIFNVTHLRPLTKRNKRWSVMASLGAGIYSAPDEIAFRSILVNGTLLFVYHLAKGLDVGVGASLSTSFGVPLVMPINYVKWTSTGRWEISIEGTRASVARQFGERFKLELVPCEMGGMSSVMRLGGENKLYSVMRIRGYLRPAVKIGKRSSLYIDAGVDLLHAVNVTDMSIRGFVDNFKAKEKWKFNQSLSAIIGFRYGF